MTPFTVVTAAEERTFERDPFGVQPFFYARVGAELVIAQSLEGVLSHPGVPLDLDDRAVINYVEDGLSADAEATVFAHVKRLPAAHRLHWQRGELAIRRYWSVPEPRPPRRDAPARLEEALRAAIRERLTAPTAVVFMSGGLDSTTLAALAREVAPEVRLLAMTSVYRSRIASVEERYATEAARSIGIDIRCIPLDGYGALQALDECVWTADPGALVTAPASRAIHAMAAEHAPVAMHGHPADAVLAADLKGYLRSLPPLQLFAALVRYTVVKRRPPYFFFRPERKRAPVFRPLWLRMKGYEWQVTQPLDSPAWSSYFEWAHPSVTGAAVELVYPWLDTRVVEAAMELAPVPWLIDKHVVRELLRGRVSEVIRRRPKTFVPADPWQAPLPVGRSLEIEAASRYIDPAAFREALRGASALSNRTLRAVALEYWLRELPSQAARLRSTNRA
ncbi:MAG TPA: asparagine synthase-related protein [Thermoanaerobaculia bacterium]